MTVSVYVNTSKQVGDKDHLKVFATEVPRCRSAVILSAASSRNAPSRAFTSKARQPAKPPSSRNRCSCSVMSRPRIGLR